MIASIDIGTSYSSICILGPDGRAQPVDIGTGTSMFGSKYSLPSAVFVEDGGNVLVGQAAMNSRRLKPQNFRMEFKRNLGEDIPILLGDRSFKPEDLYTEMFRHMKECAETVGGSQIEKTYLSYPASYGKLRKDKLRSAANASGLFEIELVDEPTAAAMCYCAEGYIKDGQTLLVYDFGGGTFDVSLIRYQDGSFQLLSEPMGLERCGGMDIDYLIAQDMRAAIDREAPGTWGELEKNPNRFMRFTGQINELAVKAKHHLSAADVFEDFIEAGMDDIHYRLTAERLNEMIAPLVGQTLQLCHRALEESGISPSELSAVLLVGGTSRIPLVREMARKITGKPALCAADLELAVAQGAIMYETYQKQEQKRREEKEKEKEQQEAKAQKKVRQKGILRTPSTPPERPAKLSMLVFPDPADKPALWEFYRKNAKQLLSPLTPVQANHRVIYDDGRGNVYGWGDIVSIACDDDRHTVGLRSDGTVVAVGDNYDGQCDVQDWRDIVSIACGWEQTAGLRSDGTVVAAGDNRHGQCDVQNWGDIVSVACDNSRIVGLRSNGTVVAVGWNKFGQCDVQNWGDIVSIACGWQHTVGLRSDGTVVAVGLHESGQCDVQNWDDIVSIACSNFHTVGLRSDGTVVAVGANDDGQCDVQDWRNIVSIACGGCHTVGLRSDGTVVAVGDNECGQCDVQGFCDIIAIYADGLHTAVLRKDGSVTITDYESERVAQKKDYIYHRRPPRILPYKLF